MTVLLPSKGVRSGSSYSLQERREIALKYVESEHGTKGAYARSVGLSPEVIRGWIAVLADGDLETGRPPRKTGVMTNAQVSEIERLDRVIAELEGTIAKQSKQLVRADLERDKALARQKAKYEKALARVEADRARDKHQWEQREAALQRAVDGLGKAIEVMHVHGTS